MARPVAPPAKRYLGMDVLTASRERISWVFDSFPRICVSFSGGKDSSVMTHLVLEQAIARGRKVGLLFLDWEAQFALTIAHVEEMFSRYGDHIEPYWVALPLTTTNAVSQVEPEWTCWDPAKRELWVRQPPERAITDPDALPFHYPEITFEEFAPAFAEWYAQRVPTASFIGIRAAESLNRWRAVTKARKSRLEGRAWTAWKGGEAFNHAHPVNSHGPTATGCTHASEYSSSYVGASHSAPSPSSERNPLNG